MKFIQHFICLGADAAQCKTILQETRPLKPKLLQVVPPCSEDTANYLTSLGTFALPRGIRALENDSEGFMTFAVHKGDSSLVYCACYTYTRRIEKRSVIRVPEVIVLVGEKPYLDMMLNVLEHLQAICSRHPRFHKHQLIHLYRPDHRELYISAMLCNFNLPSRVTEYVHYPPRLKSGAYAQQRVLCRVSKHGSRAIPNYNFATLLRKVPPQFLIRTVTALLLERKLVVKSRDETLLLPSCELILSMLNPFEWPHSYVPYLPPAMHTYVDAPLIFLIGISSDAIIPEDIFVLDLDSGSTSAPAEMDLHLLPAMQEAFLYKALVQAYEALSSGDLYAWHRCVLKYRQAFFECWMHLVSLLKAPTNRDDRAFWDAFSRTFMTQTLLQEAQLDKSHQSDEVRRFFGFVDMMKTESWDSIKQMLNMEVEIQLREYAAPEQVKLLDMFDSLRPYLDAEIRPEAAMPLEEGRSDYRRVKHWTNGSGWLDLETDWLVRLSCKGSRGHSGLSIE